MKVEDTKNALQSLREINGSDWERVVAKGKEEERNEESSSICDYFMHPSIEKEQQLLDEKHVKWIARRMEVITKETKEMFEVEYRVDKQAAEMKPAINLKERQIERLLLNEQYWMDLLLLYEVNEWERLFWIKLQSFLDQIGNLVCGPMLCTAVRGLSFFCNIYIRIYIINNNEIYKYIYI